MINLQTIFNYKIFNKIDLDKNFIDFCENTYKKINHILVQTIPKHFKERGKEFAKIIINNDFSLLNPFDPYYSQLLKISFLKNKIIGKLIINYLKSSKKIELKDYEKLILINFSEIGREIDLIFLKWRKIIYPKDLQNIFQGLAKQKKSPHKFLVKNNLDDPYSIIKKTRNGFQQISWKNAFPKEIKKISILIDGLLLKLNKLKYSKELELFINYFKVYQEALLTDPKKANDEYISVKKWKEVDQKWLKIKGRLQIIHNIESDYASIDPTRSKIAPELKIFILQEKGKIFSKIKKMKEKNIAVLSSFVPANLKKRLKGIRESLVAPSDLIIGCGSSMEFLGVAQVGPNYSDIARQGVKSYLAINSFTASNKMREKVLINIFGQKKFNQYFKIINQYFEDVIAEYIASHEISHPLINDLYRFDEFSATCVGLTSLLMRQDKKLISKKIVDICFREHIKYSLYYLTKKDDRDHYHLEGIINVKLILLSGLLVLHQNKWDIDFTKLPNFEEKIKKITIQLIALYGKKNLSKENNKKWNSFVKNLLLIPLSIQKQIRNIKTILSLN